MTAAANRVAVVTGEALIDLVLARDGGLSGHPGEGRTTSRAPSSGSAGPSPI
jgi:hypothetical protein